MPSRRDFMRTASGVGLGILGPWHTLGRAAQAGSGRRPNVLFIAVDDLRPQLNCYGRRHMHTPGFDRLASRSLLFERTYCQQAVCSPSRTSIMTGLRPDSTKVYDLNTHFRKTIPGTVTLTQHFISHGYTAIGMGKIYHGGLNDSASWTEYRKHGGKGYVLAENNEMIRRKRAEAKAKGWKGKKLSQYARAPATECADVADSAYRDGALTDAAVGALGELKQAGKPFFLAVGYVKPHLPFNAPKRYWDLYERSKVPLADNRLRPKEIPKYAFTSWGELRSYHDMKGLSLEMPDDKARRLIHGYYACVSFIDAQVGRLLDELERLDLEDDTVIVVWGDHGWHLGDHNQWCKHTNFENATWVPMMLRVPGLRDSGSRTDALTEFVDIYPSLCEACDLPLPAHLEGTSCVPLLRDPKRPWKSAAFSQYPRGKIMGYSMRTNRYRYTEWQKRDPTREAVARELYDHSRDPDENHNLAPDPAHADLVKRLSAQLAAGWRAARPPA